MPRITLCRTERASRSTFPSTDPFPFRVREPKEAYASSPPTGSDGVRDSRHTVICDLPRHTRQGSELVRRNLRMLPCQAAHERALPDRGEADEPDTGDAGPRDVEARAGAAAATARRRQELALELGQFRLQLPDVVGRRLVLLRPSHLLRRLGTRASPTTS